MTTKLTLTVEKSVIDYLETITQDGADPELSPKLKRIVGVVDLPKDFDEEEELRSRLEKKHL